MNAPGLAGRETWYIVRQLQNFKSGVRGADPADTYGRQMAPMAATLATDAMVENVIAHIGTFPDEPSPATVEGDVASGAKLYAVCAYCHGKDGMGLEATQAPRLAGMTDWYLERQLHLFKDGGRGAHPSDFYGFQMSFMARNLRDDQAIKDLVAYINTL
jgi:cytochrome c oxidase subunit 2